MVVAAVVPFECRSPLQKSCPSIIYAKGHVTLELDFWGEKVNKDTKELHGRKSRFQTELQLCRYLKPCIPQFPTPD